MRDVVAVQVADLAPPDGEGVLAAAPGAGFDAGPGGDDARDGLARGPRSRIDARIAELERLKAGLTECIGCGCLSLDRCRLANPNDRAAARGPGPRYWLGDAAAT